MMSEIIVSLIVLLHTSSDSYSLSDTTSTIATLISKSNLVAMMTSYWFLFAFRRPLATTLLNSIAYTSDTILNMPIRETCSVT